MIVVKLWYRFTGVLLKSLYKVIYGKSVHWGKSLHFRKGLQLTAEMGGTIAIGDNVFFNNDCAVHAIKEIRIGSETIFGENVHIYDHNYMTTTIVLPTRRKPSKAKAIPRRRW